MSQTNHAPSGLFIRALLTLVVPLALASCGPQSARSVQVPTEDLPPTVVTLSSTLNGQVEQVLNAASDDSCDPADAPLKKEIFLALEEKSEALRGVLTLPPAPPTVPSPTPSETPSPTPSVGPSPVAAPVAEPSPSPEPSSEPSPTTAPSPRPVPMRVGPALFFRELAPASSEGWSERILPSWAELHALYLAIKDQEVGQDWYDLNEQARSVLAQDMARLIRKRNMTLKRSQIADLVDLHERLSACLASTICRRADLINELPFRLKLLLSVSPNYSKLAQRIEKAPSPETLASDLAALTEWVGRDRRAVTFVRQSNVRLVSHSELAVTLDAGDFADAKAREALTNIFQERWRSPFRKLRVEWAGSEPESANPFRLVVSWALGNPSFVDYARHEMILVHGARTWTLQHELGHALGLPDSYFVTWNPTTCRYKIESNGGDLMSAPGASGRVLDATWKTLFDAYR